MEGHVTSSYAHGSLGYPIALAVVENGHQRLGETVFSPQADGSFVDLKIVSPVFYDPKGERSNV